MDVIDFEHIHRKASERLDCHQNNVAGIGIHLWLAYGSYHHFKTLEMASRNYWLPQMSQYIVKTCNLCNRIKQQHCWPSRELHSSNTLEEQWDVVSVNFVIELPDSHGYDVIMNVVDSVSKQAHLIPTHTTINGEEATQLYLWEIWKHHGLPRSVLLDQGPQFITEFTHELYQLLGIKLPTSMAYHPQTNSQTERWYALGTGWYAFVRGSPRPWYPTH
jgi:hypothetical protein